jgi:hypothetical protein
VSVPWLDKAGNLTLIYVATVLGLLCGLLVGYRLALAVGGWFAHKTSHGESVRTCGKVGTFVLLLPSLYLAYVVGGTLGGGIGSAVVEGTSIDVIGISVGLVIGIALVLCIGLAVGAALGSAVGILWGALLK